MPISYSDIKRYNFSQTFLLQVAKRVINDLGWHTQQQIENNTVILISKVHVSSCPKFAVAIYRGYITLNCECDPELKNYNRAQTLVNQFIHALDKHFKEFVKSNLSYPGKLLILGRRPVLWEILIIGIRSKPRCKKEVTEPVLQFLNYQRGENTNFVI